MKLQIKKSTANLSPNKRGVKMIFRSQTAASARLKASAAAEATNINIYTDVAVCPNEMKLQ
jgi:hypothetical protein